MAKPATEEKIQEWNATITKQKQSGMPVEQWCRENKIHAHNFYYWKKKLAQPPLSRASFTELIEPKKSPIVLECREIRLFIDPCFDSATLRRCLEVIKEIA